MWAIILGWISSAAFSLLSLWATQPKVEHEGPRPCICECAAAFDGPGAEALRALGRQLDRCGPEQLAAHPQSPPAPDCFPGILAAFVGGIAIGLLIGSLFTARFLVPRAFLVQAGYDDIGERARTATRESLPASSSPAGRAGGRGRGRGVYLTAADL